MTPVPVVAGGSGGCWSSAALPCPKSCLSRAPCAASLPLSARGCSPLRTPFSSVVKPAAPPSRSPRRPGWCSHLSSQPCAAAWAGSAVPPLLSLGPGEAVPRWGGYPAPSMISGSLRAVPCRSIRWPLCQWSQSFSPLSASVPRRVTVLPRLMDELCVWEVAADPGGAVCPLLGGGDGTTAVQGQLRCCFGNVGPAVGQAPPLAARCWGEQPAAWRARRFPPPRQSALPVLAEGLGGPLCQALPRGLFWDPCLCPALRTGLPFWKGAAAPARLCWCRRGGRTPLESLLRFCFVPRGWGGSLPTPAGSPAQGRWERARVFSVNHSCLVPAGVWGELPGEG